MSKNNPIVKLTYKHEFFDINEMRIGAKTITTITDDGSILQPLADRYLPISDMLT